MIFVILASFVFLFYDKLLFHIAKFVVINDPVVKSDFVLIINRNPIYQVKMFKQQRQAGYAKKVLLWVESPNRLQKLKLSPLNHIGLKAFLLENGIPDQDIILLDNIHTSLTTLSKTINQYSQGKPMTLTVITAASTSKFEKIELLREITNPDLHFSFNTYYTFNTRLDRWWKNRYGWMAYFDAYVLWLLKTIRYESQLV